jgi:hypothetical protein
MVKNKNLPTIVFFVYNRADHLKKTISSLKKTNNIEITILLFLEMVQKINLIKSK